ncbi:substrate-binding periplasmic protein [Pseudoalteromonas phenolica]|uniref:Extracellular solute-binding protein n=1 Tax=Pseudoalteromonas phenolica TaxID=161398 RepID=A0A0S2JXL3_9GAMM|nr:transporter substrate-binding domain-containing protein [Pseudoalteromonas phenolica]ALO40745.1 Extracellular solute-binding protein [Pseudoalteromonas phenolica]
MANKILKRIYVLLLFLVFSLNVQALSSTQLGSDCELVVRFENFARYSSSSDALSWHGLDVDFAKALLKEANCSYKFVSLPWGRSIKMLESGEIAMMLSMSPTKQRERFAYFIGPQRNETIVFVTHKSRPHTLHKYQDLLTLPAPVAIHRDAVYGPDIDSLLKNTAQVEDRFTVITNNKLRISMLKHGRISGFFAEKYNMLYQAENNPDYMQVEINPFVINQTPVYIALSKQSVSPKLKARLEAALTRLKQSGKIQAILKKYKLD